jgi:hypothetical protein
MPKRKVVTFPSAGPTAASLQPAEDLAASPSTVAAVVAAVAAAEPEAAQKRSKPAEKERLNFYDRKLSELEEEQELLKNGSHPELVEKLAAHRAKRDRQLNEAALLKALRHKEVDALYDYQVKEANDVCASTEKEVIERLLGEIEESLKRTRELRDGSLLDAKKSARQGKGEEDAERPDAADAGAAATTGAGDRSEQEPGEESGAAAAGAATNTTTTTTVTRSRPGTRAGAPAQKPNSDFPIQFSVPAEAVAADLTAIHQEWLAHAHKYLSQSEVQDAAVRVEDGKLFMNELVVEKGMDVIVNSEVSRESFFGVVTAVAPTEIFFKLSDGSKSRVLLAHLRSGRCKISHNADAPSSAAAVA